MEKFIYLFRGGAMDKLSPDEMQVQMQKWQAWMQEMAQNGIMTGGEPLHREGKQVTGKSKTVTDGPFIEAKEMVGGYLVVNAKDLDHAVELSKGCPIFDVDGKVEVRGIQSMQM